MTQPVRVVATLRCKPGLGGEALAPMRACVAETRREPGCIDYAAYRAPENADRIVVVELWESRDALAIHNRTPHLKALVEAVSPLAAAPLEVLVMEEI